MLDATWQNLLSSYHHLVVGLSGGVDSVVLLHVLASTPKLYQRLQAVHVHHGLSPYADQWLLHCENICKQMNIPFTAKYIQISSQSNIEECAREARYEVFSQFVGVNDCLLLAHHEDDRAETILLNLFRGSGVEGLAAMRALRPFGHGFLARPLLYLNKDSLLAYAKQHHLSWIDDESNHHIQYARNFLRHHILPHLKTRWPGVIGAINTCGQHAETAVRTLDDLALLDCPELACCPRQLTLDKLQNLPESRLNQVLRLWFKQHQIKLPSARMLAILREEVIFARQDALPCLRLGNVMIRRYRQCLYLIDSGIKEAQRTITKVSLERMGMLLPKDCSISVRYRTGGEVMRWQGHTRTLKKIFQALAVPPWIRETVPLIYVDKTLVAILDFAIADGYRNKEGD